MTGKLILLLITIIENTVNYQGISKIMYFQTAKDKLK
jgi:hypothetical protein